MKKIFLLSFLALCGFSFCAAVPSRELLNELTSQILTQQTNTKSSQSILQQLKPVFSNCANNHPNEELKFICKIFLEKDFPQIEQKRKYGNLSGIQITDLGNLSIKDRLSIIGLPEREKELSTEYIYPTDKFSYNVINFSDHGFSFFVPHLAKQDLLRENQYSSCKNSIKHLHERKTKTQKSGRVNQEQLDYINTNLETTRCYNNIKIVVNKNKKDSYDLRFDDLGAYIFYKHDIPNNNSFEDIVIQSKKGKNQIENSVYYDKKGTPFYLDDNDTLSDHVHGVKLGYTGDVSSFTKKPLGIGKNLQKMIENGDAKLLVSNNRLFIWLKSAPSVYYEISMGWIDGMFGGFSAIDINNKDGTSSFII